MKRYPLLLTSFVCALIGKNCRRKKRRNNQLSLRRSSLTFDATLLIVFRPKHFIAFIAFMALHDLHRLYGPWHGGELEKWLAKCLIPQAVPKKQNTSSFDNIKKNHNAPTTADVFWLRSHRQELPRKKKAKQSIVCHFDGLR